MIIHQMSEILNTKTVIVIRGEIPTAKRRNGSDLYG